MRNLYWGIALVVFGTLLLLDNMGYADIGELLSDYWPLLLILLGANILMRRNADERAAATAAGADAPPAPTAEWIHASNLLGDVAVRSASQAFKGGSVSTLLGDSRVDLSGVRIADGPHELRVHGLMGTSTIILPQGTPYSVFASTTFGTITLPGSQKGGFGSRLHMISPSFGAAQGRLTIHVSHLFGDARVEESSSVAGA
jgi:predicted membrane protein